MVAEFIEAVKTECVGQDVVKSVTPGQQVVKIVNDKLVELLGGGVSELNFAHKPTAIMLVGLHGSGKTTTAGKLALKLKRDGKKVLLVAGDVYRPAAIDQLEIIGKEISVPVHAERTSVNVAAIAVNAVEQAGGRASTWSSSTPRAGCRSTRRWCRNWSASARPSSRRSAAGRGCPRSARRRFRSRNTSTGRSTSPASS